MAQVAKEGIDFRLICVPHHCHKADKYLSRLFFLAIADHVSDTFRRRGCMQMEQVCCGSSCRGRGWSGGAMALGKLPVPGRPTIWITVGQGPTALAVGAGGSCLDFFTLIYPFFPLFPSLGRRPDID